MVELERIDSAGVNMENVNAVAFCKQHAYKGLRGDMQCLRSHSRPRVY